MKLVWIFFVGLLSYALLLLWGGFAMIALVGMFFMIPSGDFETLLQIIGSATVGFGLWWCVQRYLIYLTE